MSMSVESTALSGPLAPGVAPLITEDSVVQFLGKAQGPHYPKLTSHEGILIRSLAIADNLDEVLSLPRGMIFPLHNKKFKLMRRKVTRTKGTEGSNLKKRRPDQESEYKQDEE